MIIFIELCFHLPRNEPSGYEAGKFNLKTVSILPGVSLIH